ncbi:protein mono-ADP-ribosyltransferase PARP14-like [Gambusia affinis]|uniref:protein mono-ADP-ribosyltransferase PARP14-like n=1 Tax=Gambusia affinis TaxID=33528 RepID=UPI001CDBAEFF|nr:protein mono-ADP-ribosyltransferase PARP14-like [Gambusia affinis]
MEDSECPAVTVEGDWSPAQSKTVRNKLQLYFQSKKKSSGGDCRVEVEEEAARASVFFRAEEVRDQVLAKTDHEITVEGRRVRLRLGSGPAQIQNNSSSNGSDPAADSKNKEPEPEEGAAAARGSESEPVGAVVLENVSENLNKDYLQMLVETISGLEESNFSLEMIWESNLAVVNFSVPTDVEKFISVSQKNSKMKKHGLTARPLGAAKSVRMESLPPSVLKDMIELWFERNWELPEDVVMIPEEQAAIVTFRDPKVVQSICVKEDHVMRSIPVKLYSYHESLGTALYGPARPAWKMPEPVTQKVLRVIWKFLLFKKMLKSINNQMQPHFCSVDLDQPEVKLRPLPSFLRQKGLTAKDVDNWAEAAKDAFCKLLAQYSAFECDANTEAWKAAEKEVLSVVKEDALVEFDPSREVVTVAGRADDIKRIRAPVENILLKLMSRIERQTKGVTEGLDFSPAYFHILTEEGLQKAASDVSPELELSFNEATGRLTITGLPAEVYQIKSWILEKNLNMKKKHLNVPAGLLEYLQQVDPMVMSKSLFTLQGISAIYCTETRGVFLLGSSDRALADAESKMKKDLLVQSLDVKDQEVLNRQNWKDLTGELLDTYNSSNNQTVIILIHPERRDKVTVAGFTNPVKEVSASLRDFIQNYSRVQEALRVESCAVAQFIQKNRHQVWSRIASDNNVSVTFDPERPKIVISGARLHAHKAKSVLQQLAADLFADTLTVDKPGAKKYFLSQGSIFLPPVMSEFSCVVMLQPEIQDNEEEEEEGSVEDQCYCKVRTASGVLVSVSRADICSFKVDTVVNALGTGSKILAAPPAAQTSAFKCAVLKCRNSSLQVGSFFSSRFKAELKSCSDLCLQTDGIVNTVAENMNLSQGAVSSAILEAAGENLQLAVLAEAGVSALQAGDVVVTDAYNLSCQKVLHAVCPNWDNGGGEAEKGLADVITSCLKEAEKLRLTSLSFPAIGTGNLRFPRQVVARVLLRQIQLFSRRVSPRHLKDVVIVVHHSDRQTTECFTREFSGQTGNVQHGGDGSDRNGSAAQTLPSRTQQTSTSFSSVSSPSLGVYRMQMGQLALEVSSGDITKETCDVIVNSSNQNFNLQAGVSKAILDNAGPSVLSECAQIVTSPGYMPRSMIMTSGGQLPSSNIIHIVGQNDAAKIKEMVQGVLQVCEEKKFRSVAFPALGTGQGGVSPSAVADAMVGAVVDFVRKKHPKFVCSVKILIFQTAMIAEFHNSMKKRQGQDLAEKSVFNKFIDSVSSFLGLGAEQQSTTDFYLERQEFDPAVFQLCADNQRNLNTAKKRISELILTEQAQRTIRDQYINQFTQADMDELKALQRNLTVSIRLDRGQEDQEPRIHLEGLTRDVLTAESDIRNIIRKVEKSENLKDKARMVSKQVEWKFQHQDGSMVSTDILTNLQLEEALEKSQTVKIKIKNETFSADPVLRRAVSTSGRKQIELMRNDLRTPDNPLPQHWEDMKGSILKQVLLTAGSQEYNDVLADVTKNGLFLNIIQIERIQNTTLWQSYQLLKKQMEVKNKHTNNEKLLYHGTGANSIDLINSKGFNRSYAGMHGAAYGNGSYFAVDPAYSAGGYAKPDRKGHKRMYQARVLVGDYTRGTSGMIAPPAKSGNAADLYDTVTDRANNPTMFIVFHDIQAYPEYLITFT